METVETLAVLVDAPAEPVQVPVDASDPIVALLAWILAAALKHFLREHEPALRRFIPIAAVLIAVAARGAYAAVEGEPFNGAVLLRAIAAGAVAVAGHSQIREVVKHRERKKAPKKPAPQPPDPV